MSVTVEILKSRVRDLIGDVDSEQPVINPFRLDVIINKQIHRLSAKTIRPQETVQSITLVVGTYDYALASSGLVAEVAQVFLDADGAELIGPVPFDVFNSRYRQATSEPAASGRPCEYTVWETAANVATLRVGPTPDAASDGPLKVYHSIMPTALANTTFPANASILASNTTLPFGNELIAGLEAACAAEASRVMTAADRERAGIDKATIAGWVADAEEGVRAHNLRQRRLGRQQDHIFRVRSWAGRWPVRV